MIEQLKAVSVTEAAGLFLAANIAIFFGSVGLCSLLGRLFDRRRIFDRWEPLRTIEVSAAVGAIFLNTAVSVAGWWLWTQGQIGLINSGVAVSIVDCLLMVLFMDLGMYIFHRLAHLPWIYRIIHSFHHRHETTNPISLFVLHPLEVIGFGGLMIAFLVAYTMSVGGLVAYLSLNVLFGTLGHSGVEPFPRNLRSIPIIRWVGTSTFHAEHHEHQSFNFGFYTLIWDKLFGTLDPEYEARFEGTKSPRPE